MTFDDLFKNFLNGDYKLPPYPGAESSFLLAEYAKQKSIIAEKCRNDTIDAILHSGYEFSRAQAEAIYNKAKHDETYSSLDEVAGIAQSLMDFANTLLNC